MSTNEDKDVKEKEETLSSALGLTKIGKHIGKVGDAVGGVMIKGTKTVLNAPATVIQSTFSSSANEKDSEGDKGSDLSSDNTKTNNERGQSNKLTEEALNDAVKILLQFPYDKDTKETALHLACTNGCSDTLIMRLLKANPCATKMKNSYQELPMHSAASSEQALSKKALKALIDSYPLALVSLSEREVPYNGPIKEEDAQLGYLYRFLIYVGYYNDPRNERPSPVETNLSPLHCAILFGALPDVVDAILDKNSSCVSLQTSRGRTALECGKAILKEKNIQNPSNEKDQEGFAALPQTLRNMLTSMDAIENSIIISKNRQSLRSTIQSTKESIASGGSNQGDTSKDYAELWKKAAFSAGVIAKMQKPCALGPSYPFDFKQAPPKPQGFELPPDLDFVGIDETLPVGFKRMRWVLLNNQCKFMPVNFYDKFQNMKKVKFDPWDKHDDAIGLADVPEGINEEDFIGAKKKIEYLFPRTIFCGASMAYEDQELLAHNDYCFSYQKATSVPQVPFGSTFIAVVQMTVINMGHNQSRVIGSVEPRWTGKQPLVGRQIRNALRTGCTYYFTTLGEEMCNEGNPFAEKKTTRGGW
eukprot:CAMPEP_0184858606 /NCGR_PEP_ID=MMETSP0580-20130426/3686_1 /TAXON_ID=1118495 /ORGANISM="Dactyliosolen fragilissimus" /LENGTH=587 /DNA_ID=CAMNT_0027354837 /DNA_START=28 /DNA_END=1791 /DNA_ORIENTATION=+